MTWHIQTIDSCTSTNDLAHEQAKQGAPHGTVISARIQTKGRGRQGRTWFTEEGGLALSVLLRLPITAQQSTRLSHITAWSICDTIHQLEVDAKIKWPNDILINGKKIGGILIEISSAQQQLDYAVIGIGINVHSPADGLPIEIRDIACSLDQFQAVHMRDFQHQLLSILEHNLAATSSENLWQRCLAYARQHSATIGQLVTRSEGTQVIHGLAVDLNAEGALVVRDEGGTLQTLYFGELETTSASTDTPKIESSARTTIGPATHLM